MIPINDQGMEMFHAAVAGNLIFELKGKRLKGRWHLVRMRGRAGDGKRENWLLIKGKDEYADPRARPRSNAITRASSAAAAWKASPAVRARVGAEAARPANPRPKPKMLSVR